MSKSQIAFQGSLGAYSDLACREAFSALQTLPCSSFEAVFEAVERGEASIGMIPVDNSVAGRVADIHHLLPQSQLFITGEHFQRVNHQLLVLPGVEMAELATVSSHIHALNQCRRFIREHGLRPVVHSDTAGAAKALAASDDRTRGVIASSLAATLYGLQILRGDIEDADHNTTRFLVMAPSPNTPPLGTGRAVTSFMFRVRNLPAALYKSLGGFATNGINLTKIESYLDSQLSAARFYVDVEGHEESPSLQRAFEELRFYADEVRVFGCYLASPFRQIQPPLDRL